MSVIAGRIEYLQCAPAVDWWCIWAWQAENGQFIVTAERVACWATIRCHEGEHRGKDPYTHVTGLCAAGEAGDLTTLEDTDGFVGYAYARSELEINWPVWIRRVADDHHIPPEQVRQWTQEDRDQVADGNAEGPA